MPPTRGISCLSLVLYGIWIGSEGPFVMTERELWNCGVSWQQSWELQQYHTPNTEQEYWDEKLLCNDELNLRDRDLFNIGNFTNRIYLFSFCYFLLQFNHLLILSRHSVIDSWIYIRLVWCSHNAILAFANNLSGFCRFLQHKPNIYWLHKASTVWCWKIHIYVSRFILQYSNQLKWKVFSKVCLVDLLRKAKAIC